VDLELVAGVSAVALIISLVQLAKQAQLLPSRWAGLAAVVLGLILSLTWTAYRDAPMFQGVITGLALGLSAAGLWSTGKHVYRG
jgi:flagellar biosynthesis protein FliR